MRRSLDPARRVAAAAAMLAFASLAGPPVAAQQTGGPFIQRSQPDGRDARKPDAASPEAGPTASDAARQPRPKNRDRFQNLDFLFGALKVAPDEESAKGVENRIQALLLASGSDTADLLMNRSKTAADAKDNGLAIRLLDAVVEFKPDYVEAWNRRATLNFAEKNYAASLADLRQVLAREPRHFGALVGLGLIMQELGEDKRALEIFRRAVEVYPLLPRIPERIKELSEKVEGRAI